MTARFLIPATVLLCFGVPLSAQATLPEEFFEKRVRPIFLAKCAGCHNATSGTAGLNLTTAAGIRKGADTGPVLNSQDPESSRLLQVVSYRERLKMPPTGKLSESELTALREWVLAGAPWPKQETSAEAPLQASPSKKGYSRAQKEFWSFRPLGTPMPPAVRNEGWAHSPIDRFILSKLESRGLTPAAAAEKTTLIHRAAYDLTGLPPTEQEIEAFKADSSADAFAKVVDHYLASPRYGEKWGRHWLDVARYADSTGADEDYRYPHAWRYRDYVINAFNRDLPYDQFLREQIAGDLLPPPPDQSVNKDGIVATGFLALGPKLVAEQDKVKMFYDIVDEQIDVTSKAILGLTIACARCHDHKFDPISTKDYYSLASIFASTKQLSQIEGTVSKLYYAPLVPKDIAERYERHQEKVAEKQKEIDAVIGAEARRYRDQFAPRMAEYMMAARSVYADHADPAEIAKTRSLELPLLERWTKYLTPTKERRAHLELWYHASPDAIDSVAKRYQDDFIAEVKLRQAAQDAWKLKADAARAKGEKVPPAPKFLAGDNRFFTEVGSGKGPLTLPEKEPENFYSTSAKEKLATLRAELAQIKAAAPPEPPFACGVAEDKPVEQHVFLRGNPEAKGELVPKRFPTVLAGEAPPAIASVSGRRELAEWLVNPENPLTARVFVNRLWQGHFGEGLVRTPNNFGLSGERPTHPELLDWLARQFISQGWSVKKMHRLIMLSSTYQMSSDTAPLQQEKDPDNRWLTRFSMRRKTVEEIRDSLLNLDGSLDLTMGGSLQKGEGTDNEFSDGRKSLHPDETKRRTVYLPLRRSNLATLFTLYDFGDATTSSEGRSQTNVAPQALFMMNSKFVSERSRSLAQHLIQSQPSDTARVRRAWVAVLGREPAPAELDSSLQYVSNFPHKTEDESGTLLAWTSLCRTLIASNDFIYVH